MSDNNYQKWLHGELSDSDLSHRQAGAFQERERIIKLLETELEKLLPIGEIQKNEHEGLCSAIALIKGKQK